MCPPKAFDQQGSDQQGTNVKKGPNLENLEGSLRGQIPDHKACEDAYRLAQSLLPASIFNHSFRVWLYAKALVTQDGYIISTTKPHILFVACILHDVGCASRFNGPQRFEVEAADVAVDHLRQYDDSSEEDVQNAWQGIALHTSPGIAERMTSYTQMVRAGVVADFGGRDEPQLPAGLRQIISRQLPRGQIEKDLGDIVAGQAEKQPQKAPAASWPGILLRAKLENPEWLGVNKAFTWLPKDD